MITRILGRQRVSFGRMAGTVFLVDYGDHFEHNDHRLSNINFLQYSDALWRVIAGNR